jgi:hypothetical protein
VLWVRREVRKNGGPEVMADKQHTSGCQERLLPTKAERERLLRRYSQLTGVSSSSSPGLGLKAKPTGETIPVVAK